LAVALRLIATGSMHRASNVALAAQHLVGSSSNNSLSNARPRGAAGASAAGHR
jgi:hypothetical protein